MNRLYIVGLVALTLLSVYAGSVRAAASPNDADENDRPEGVKVYEDPVVIQWMQNNTRLCALEEILWLAYDPYANESGAETYTIWKDNHYYVGVKNNGDDWKPDGRTDTTYELEGAYVQVEKNGVSLGWIGGVSDDERRILSFNPDASYTWRQNGDVYKFTTLPGVINTTVAEDTFEDSNCTIVCCQRTAPKYIYFNYASNCSDFIFSAPATFPGIWPDPPCNLVPPDSSMPTNPPDVEVDPVEFPEGSEGDIPTGPEPMPDGTKYVKSCFQSDDVSDSDCEHGYINQETCKCTCIPNWEGDECQDCMYDGDQCKGDWDDDQCKCKCDYKTYWGGQWCDECRLVGPNGKCFISGQETNGWAKDDCKECECEGRWKPPFCLECDLDCQGNKMPDDMCEECICKGQWAGSDCNTCTIPCVSGKGVLDADCTECVCQGGYSGTGCSTCGLNCQHGTPDENCLFCQCTDGYMGRDCDRKCGDGIVQEPEACDGGDHCTSACSLKSGYVCDGGVCSDVNECASGSLNKCPAGYTCVNQNGGYRCECPSTDPGCVQFDPLEHPGHFRGHF